MLKGRGCRQYIENERGWTDLVAGHGFRVLICCPPIRMSLSLFVIGGAGAFAAVRWWCVGPHSPYAGGLLCPSSLMVWWCGVLRCGSRVVAGWAGGQSSPVVIQ